MLLLNIAEVLVFLHFHQVLLGDEDVRTLLLLVVKLLNKLIVGFVEVDFLFRVVLCGGCTRCKRIRKRGLGGGSLVEIRRGYLRDASG